MINCEKICEISLFPMNIYNTVLTKLENGLFLQLLLPVKIYKCCYFSKILVDIYINNKAIGFMLYVT